MSRSKHTPGPWLVMGNQRNGHFDYVLPQASNEEFQANCRLIAAAPELLKLFKRGLECGIFDGAPVYRKDVVDLIAKAEGHTNG